MRIKNFMLANAVLAAIAGIIIVLIPSVVVRAFGLPADSRMDIDGQLYGSELILMGLVAWFARDITDLRTQRGIISAFTIANLISLVLSIIALVNHSFNAVGWVAVIAYAILFVVYGAYWLARPSEMRAPEQPQETQHIPS